ncbi:unnamed protein product [Ilex paraguariensis]|uniref:Uncharacterized protein n=1 Tax=Ilex paraguariensis TaxID=185542 RepID=A0ABC8TVZ5_9AQUA
MMTHSYATDTPNKATDLATTVIAASSPPQIIAACGAIESFLQKHTPDQARWFFSITFPTLICKIFGFEESSPAQKPHSPNGWIEIVSQSNDSELSSRVFRLLLPNGVLMSSMSAVDRLSLVKYVFPIERLPEWVRNMLQNERDYSVLADLCSLFKGRVKEDSVKGSSFQVQLNVFEYYMFWYAYYPVCRGNYESCGAVRVQRSRRFRLENWTHSIPVFSSAKRGTERKVECNLYTRLLYAYLHAFVPACDLNAHPPYRSSLLHYSSGYDSLVLERAGFFVSTLIHFWLVNNDFSPLAVATCKSFGVTFPFRSVLGETPPTSGLGEVVNVFVKYLNFSMVTFADGSDHVKYSESPRWRISGSVDFMKSKDATSGTFGVHSVSSWNSWIQRPLYRYVLRAFLFCPVQTSIKNASQVFSVWINYMEPWAISLEDFVELAANEGISRKNMTMETSRSPSRGYSSSWQGFVLANYLFYSSLVMHFVGFAHKFLHTDAEVIVQMVSKVCFLPFPDYYCCLALLAPLIVCVALFISMQKCDQQFLDSFILDIL